ncbi:MAG TPA: hypothetical protein VHF69_04700 [Candidatus Synoicihabitans sp.]|nr:hypothetical protein [Candidatus Synoicihabitans sp.]
MVASRRVDQAVAALCVQRRSVYHGMSGVEAYDIDRDARTFRGGMPVVAHPPCRGWSNKCRHQAKPLPGERELGLWCADQVTRFGGVLEQPAHSHLFAAAGLPIPGQRGGRSDGHWSIEVWQAWWGYPMRKATWLYVAGVDPRRVEFPFALHALGADGRRFQVMSRNQRSATMPAFAAWLVELARKSRGGAE